MLPASGSGIANSEVHTRFPCLPKEVDRPAYVLRSLHGRISAVAEGDGEPCSKFFSDLVRTKQVAETSSDRAVQFHRSPEQEGLPNRRSFGACLQVHQGMAPVPIERARVERTPSLTSTFN